jgi:mRNA interferase RelE/StbE
LNPDIREKIEADFRKLANDPFAKVDVKKLEPKSDNEYRLRVRDWRAIFEYNKAENRIEVLRVDDRKDSYRGR